MTERQTEHLNRGSNRGGSHQPLNVSLDAVGGLEFDVLVIGSGPAGTAVAERLYTKHPGIRTCVLERGPVLTTTHVNNFLRESPGGTVFGVSKVTKRTDFITAFEVKPWEGDFKQGGMLLFALGGRGIVAGAHLRRFYEEDLTCWPKHKWPIDMSVLESYYEEAERVRNVSYGECSGRSQYFVLNRLNRFHAAEPPWGVDVRSGKNGDISQGFDSAAARLWALLASDEIERKLAAKGPEKRRLVLATDTYVSAVRPEKKRVTVTCMDARAGGKGKKVDVYGKVVVLAASPIESARLVLNSIRSGALAHPTRPGDAERPVGNYLAEHIYLRAEVVIPAPCKGAQDQYVNVVVPPAPGADQVNRFHVHVLGEPDPGNPSQVRLRFTGEVAMDPQRSNRVELEGRSGKVDEFGVPKARVVMNYSRPDSTRRDNCRDKMLAIAKALDADLSESGVKELAKGRSHHEAGTLRMGTEDADAVTSATGQLHGVPNLYVADASVLPCVGVANPMLTITAWAYRVADQIARSHFRSR